MVSELKTPHGNKNDYLNSKLSEPETEELRLVLKEVGLRCTKARLTVIQELKQASVPVSHAELADKLVPLGFDKATVFRNLVDLADAGLLRRIELGDHVWRFEWIAQETGSDEHPHFLCIVCGDVSCLRDLAFELPQLASADVFGEVTEILLKGQCSKCLTAAT
ncbi:Ferric uptake regulation protein [Polystyrenella longa]|uniref:Ferric uptake regulation protein n=1 Tax=Polystyrenella longa TaxID=2528007 RepID=A0A518CRL7_9PLAN|nr:transcriptional repressor [Polystyrenella longa]QDU81855.1 Ferric uptake regulation protein [Polystyrenella longa]